MRLSGPRTIQREQQAEVSGQSVLREKQQRPVWLEQVSERGEWQGVMQSVVSCREDFGFCPKCEEMSLEDFEQRSAMIRLVLKDPPDFHMENRLVRKAGGKARSRETR